MFVHEVGIPPLRYLNLKPLPILCNFFAMLILKFVKQFLLREIDYPVGARGNNFGPVFSIFL